LTKFQGWALLSILAALLGGAMYHFELGGRLEWLLAAGSVLPLFGAILFLVLRLRKLRGNLTAATMALRENEKRNQTLIELLPETVYEVSRGGGDGYQIQSLRPAPLLNWLQDAEAHRRSIENAFAFGRMETGGIDTPEGSHLEYSLVPVQDSGGVTGAIGIVRDRTAQRRAEEERRRLEEKLRQAQKMEGVGRLAGGVAHDFNNLLTVIIGYASVMLNESAKNSSDSQNLNQILTAANKAATLTQQLLAFSRKQAIHPRVTDLNRIVSESTGMLSRLLGSDIVLKTSLSPGLPPVLVDRGQMDQLLMNLSANARDAMPDGGFFSITTALRTWTELDAEGQIDSKPGGCIELTVSDSGYGMESKAAASMFEAFGNVKAEEQETELGLATVYNVVRQSGDWIRAESEPGAGSTFRIYLPAQSPAPNERPAEERNAHSSNVPNSQGTILIAEDQKDIRELESRALTAKGYRVIAASDPMAALTASENYPDAIDLLLTDIVMPGMRGPELARRIRIARPDIKLLFVSGYAGELQEGRDQLVLESTLLSKPFGAQTLVESVRRCMAES
jgi:hypothetical protein